ncbi:hypothetical protein N9L68_02805 [bacterium]|nr:hypothetical protein [bacterium]
MERPAKLRGINDMRARLPYTSNNAFAALLRVARDGGLPDVVRTHDIRRASDLVAEQDTPHGALLRKFNLVQANGGNIQVEMPNPHALLYASCKCQKFANLMSRTMRKFPSSVLRPWNIILYNDEANVENRLKQDNRRTLVAVHWRFFGVWPSGAQQGGFLDGRGHGQGEHRSQGRSWDIAGTRRATEMHVRRVRAQFQFGGYARRAPRFQASRLC